MDLVGRISARCPSRPRLGSVEVDARTQAADSGLTGPVRSAYEQHLRGRPVEASLLATFAYLLTLLAVRLFTTATHAGTGDDIVVGATHIHHVVFGILALLLAGVLSLDEVFRLPRSILFGIGAALVLDEFALVVFLKDVYWLPQGSLSLVALVIGLVALVVNVWRSSDFIAAVRTARRPPGDNREHDGA
jgi:hypothetical protein